MFDQDWIVEGTETKFPTFPKQESKKQESKSIITETAFFGFDIEIIENLPAETYHSYKEYISASVLREAKTPAHFQILINFQQDEKEITKSMNFGTAFHTLFLEPEKFQYFLFEDTEKVNELLTQFSNPRASKIYKEWKENELKKNIDNYSIIDKKDFQLLNAAKKRLNKNSFIKDWMQISKKEVSYFLSRPDYKLKIRPDAICEITTENKHIFEDVGFDYKVGEIVVCSLKTSNSAHPSHFIRHAISMEYHISESFYHDCIQKIYHNAEKIHILFVVIEKNNGLYMIYELQDDFIEYGRQEYSKRLNQLLESLNTGDFDRGYETLNNGSLIMPIHAPAWTNFEME